MKRFFQRWILRRRPPPPRYGRIYIDFNRERRDPATPEWREYRRKCRKIARLNAGPGGYMGYPLPPGVKQPPVPAAWRRRADDE